MLSVTEGSGILNMLFHDSFLLAGCETSCFVFNIDPEAGKQRQRSVTSPHSRGRARVILSGSIEQIEVCAVYAVVISAGIKLL